MSVFTVFFCGTGSNSFDPLNNSYWNGELVSTLASNMNSKEFADWVVIDGPGSGNLQADALFTEPKGYGLSGTLFGKGWEENVAHAVSIIKGKTTWERTELSKQNYERLKSAGVEIPDAEKQSGWLWRTYFYGERKVTQQALQEQIIKVFRKGGIIPTQVNIVGWSRGGVSCHMLANAMLADPQLKDIPVNIFAIDPVPGLLNFQKHRVTLGANVKQYVGFYARDERSKGFACVTPQTTPGTLVNIFPFVGRHATLVGNAAADGANGAKAFIEPGLIIRHYAEQCLTRWGASLDKKLNLTTAQIDEHLRKISKDEDAYIKMRKHSYTLLTEDTKGDRSVSLADKGIGFGDVSGAQFQPVAGLSAPMAPVHTYHKPIS